MSTTPASSTIIGQAVEDGMSISMPNLHASFSLMSSQSSIAGSTAPVVPQHLVSSSSILQDDQMSKSATSRYILIPQLAPGGQIGTGLSGAIYDNSVGATFSATPKDGFSSAALPSVPSSSSSAAFILGQKTMPHTIIVNGDDHVPLALSVQQPLVQTNNSVNPTVKEENLSHTSPMDVGQLAVEQLFTTQRLIFKSHLMASVESTSYVSRNAWTCNLLVTPRKLSTPPTPTTTVTNVADESGNSGESVDSSTNSGPRGKARLLSDAECDAWIRRMADATQTTWQPAANNRSQITVVEPHVDSSNSSSSISVSPPSSEDLSSYAQEADVKEETVLCSGDSPLSSAARTAKVVNKRGLRMRRVYKCSHATTNDTLASNVNCCPATITFVFHRQSASKLCSKSAHNVSAELAAAAQSKASISSCRVTVNFHHNHEVTDLVAKWMSSKDAGGQRMSTVQDCRTIHPGALSAPSVGCSPIRSTAISAPNSGPTQLHNSTASESTMNMNALTKYSTPSMASSMATDVQVKSEVGEVKFTSELPLYINPPASDSNSRTMLDPQELISISDVSQKLDLVANTLRSMVTSMARGTVGLLAVRSFVDAFIAICTPPQDCSAIESALFQFGSDVKQIITTDASSLMTADKLSKMQQVQDKPANIITADGLQLYHSGGGGAAAAGAAAGAAAAIANNLHGERELCNILDSGQNITYMVASSVASNAITQIGPMMATAIGQQQQQQSQQNQQHSIEMPCLANATSMPPNISSQVVAIKDRHKRICTEIGPLSGDNSVVAYTIGASEMSAISNVPFTSISTMANSGNSLTTTSTSAAAKRKKRTRCGECEGCMTRSTTQDCRECRNCLDQKRYGGPGRLKKACMRRSCLVMGSNEGGVSTKCSGSLNSVSEISTNGGTIISQYDPSGQVPKLVDVQDHIVLATDHGNIPVIVPLNALSANVSQATFNLATTDRSDDAATKSLIVPIPGGMQSNLLELDPSMLVTNSTPAHLTSQELLTWSTLPGMMNNATPIGSVISSSVAAAAASSMGQALNVTSADSASQSISPFVLTRLTSQNNAADCNSRASPLTGQLVDPSSTDIVTIFDQHSLGQQATILGSQSTLSGSHLTGAMTLNSIQPSSSDLKGGGGLGSNQNPSLASAAAAVARGCQLRYLSDSAIATPSDGANGAVTLQVIQTADFGSASDLTGQKQNVIVLPRHENPTELTSLHVDSNNNNNTNNNSGSSSSNNGSNGVDLAIQHQNHNQHITMQAIGKDNGPGQSNVDEVGGANEDTVLLATASSSSGSDVGPLFTHVQSTSSSVIGLS